MLLPCHFVCTHLEYVVMWLDSHKESKTAFFFHNSRIVLFVKCIYQLLLYCTNKHVSDSSIILH